MIHCFRRLLDIFRRRPAEAPADETGPEFTLPNGTRCWVHTTCYGRLANDHLRIQVVAVFDPDDNRHSAYKIYLN